MMHEDTNDIELEAYFKAERGVAPVPSDDLLARIMADAKDQSHLAERFVVIVKQNPWATFWAAVGGWPTAAGMATAGLVGVWIGFSQPIGLDELANSYFGLGDDSYLVDLLPAFGDEFGEG